MTHNRDRRNYSRVPFEIEARLIVDEQALPGTVIDMSLKGALVELAQKTTADGGPVRLDIALATAPGEEIRMSGTIAHRHGRQVGIVWREIDLDSLTRLRRLLELNLGDSTLLERELAAMLESVPAQRS